LDLDRCHIFPASDAAPRPKLPTLFFDANDGHAMLACGGWGLECGLPRGLVLAWCTNP
jgi:hypothetical protein